jgi:hypothetical protein
LGITSQGTAKRAIFVPGEEVASIEDDLPELEQEEGDIGGTDELGRHGVSLIVLLRVLRAKPSQHAIRDQCQERIERGRKYL